MGAIIGFVVGVLFIIVQPYFGMSPLTDCHAQAYMKLSDIQPSVAIAVAWSAHLIVSVGYGVATGIALLISKHLLVYAFYIALLGWFTTVIAGPANALIVRLVTSDGGISFANLPAYNFNLDAKLALHIIFFAAIGVTLYGTKRFLK